ncbi:MAG TPA: AAA family ATPase, partial [Terriglobia bacterium]|nr:AAA family ATPase [Terriglobia bacterium]
MLRLQKIQIQGFKSFADKTDLIFKGEGITAIVGPNGCGKSNISDAIAWVLGEQSPKSLRGGRMEDVIFNGTRMRLPLGLAEVALTFVDPEMLREASYRMMPSSAESENPQNKSVDPATLLVDLGGSLEPKVESAGPADSAVTVEIGAATAAGRKRRPKVQTDPGELVISRRLFRSGESEYLINGRQVRLRDIQDIFMGTGLGPDSYAIIEQGRVGMILSSKPSDRRAIIEEAAGITKFKSKRKLAESRLEQAKQNLLRINDIAEEVSKQLNSLKRQAARARRYGELREKMRDISKRLFVAREMNLLVLVRQNDEALNSITEQYRQQHQEILDKEVAYRQNNLVLQQKDDHLKLLREQLAILNLELERAQQKIQYQREQSRELESRSQENSLEIERLHQQEQICLEEFDQKQQALQEAKGNLDKVQFEFQAQNSYAQGLQMRIQELESTDDQYQSQLLDSVGRAAALRNQVVQLDELEKRLQQQIARLNVERAETGASRDLMTRDLDSSRRQFEQHSQRLKSLRETGTALAQKLSELKSQEASLVEALNDTKEKFSASSHRLESLKELVAHHAYSTEAVRILLSAASDAAGDGFRTSGILADVVEVDSPYEATVEDFLKQELEYLLVENPSEAAGGISFLRKKGAGKGTFLLWGNGEKGASSDWQAQVSELAREEFSAIPLSTVIRFPEPIRKAAHEALPHLQQAFIVPNYQQAWELAQNYPQLIFLTVEGEMVRGRLISGGGRTTGGHLSMKREIRELNRRVDSLRKEIGVKEEAQQSLRQSIHSVEAEVDDVRDQTQELDKALLGSELQVKQLESELDRLTRREELARLELQRIEGETIQVAEQKGQYEMEITTTDAAKSEIENLIAEQQSHLRQLK